MVKKEISDPEGGWPAEDSRLASFGSSLCYGSQLARFRFWCTALLVALLVLYLPYSVMRFTVKMTSTQPGYLSMLYAPGTKCNNINVFMGNTANKSMPPTNKPHSHIKCRSEFYPRGDKVRRWPVPDEKVPWKVPFPDYTPTIFTSDSVASKPVWADPDFAAEKVQPPPEWNSVDGKVDRRSYTGNYEIVGDLPRNPVGRTGLAHRGTLGRWGPNHAADPIVTRWKIDVNGSKIIHPKTQRPILQFIAIKRRDSGIWALPGGMVDPGEKINVTLRREFSEEAMNSLQSTAEEMKLIEERIANLFKKGEEIYRGYVDDPRNTDNSWMETIAFNFHDESGNSVAQFKLHAGDDAVGVKWTDMDRSLNLFASHTDFVSRVAQKHNAHW